MNDKMQIFEDLDVLVRMCHAKNDGASLTIEEDEIKHKIKEYEEEIADIKASAVDDNYDSGAEMADRNVEIITKKLISSIKAELKIKNADMNGLKEQEKELSSTLSTLKASKESHEAYISSMKDRIASTSDDNIASRYNSLIRQTESKIASLTKELEEVTKSYNELQDSITTLSDNITSLEEKLSKKKEQLAETQYNLENKDTYIDQAKLEKNNRKINDLEVKKQKLDDRLEEIYNDPKYLEAKIKNVLNESNDAFPARAYLTRLIKKAMSEPYMNVEADNALEEELLRATQARDTFANEIDQKSYNIMETVNPAQIRVEYLKEKISAWQTDLDNYNNKISMIDKDEQFNYQERMSTINELITSLKEEVEEFKKAYEDEPESNLSSKASLKVNYEEKKSDLAEAERVASAFMNDEAEDIRNSISLLKNECTELKANIEAAQDEIKEIQDRLISRQSGLIDISAQNKDKEHLRKLAQVVMDIKHRRQFANTPEQIAKKLEKELGIDLTNISRYEEPTISIDKQEEVKQENVDYQNDLKEKEIDNSYEEQKDDVNNNIIELQPTKVEDEEDNYSQTPVDFEEKNNNIDYESDIVNESNPSIVV